MLIDFDGINSKVVVLVAVLANGAVKGVTQFINPIMENIGKANQYRQGNPIGDQVFSDGIEVDRGLAMQLVNDIASIADIEVTLAPEVRVVGGAGFCHAPAAITELIIEFALSH